MDRITTKYVEAFQSEQSLSDVEPSTLFELFADYCVVSDAYDEEFDVVADVHVGGEADLGIDGLAIVVNGAMVSSVEEVEDLAKVNGYLDVRFIFVQAKSSSSFSGEQIASFLDGVQEFFEEVPSLPMSDRLADLHSIMAFIYANSIKFRRHRPSLFLAFVTTGQWKDDVYLNGKIAKGVERLEEMGLFEDVKFLPMGFDELQKSYQRSKNSIVAEFTFSNKVLLPDIDGVSESYLGVLPATEFLTMIMDSGGNIRKSLFYDNIRDFQDYNAVNGEIRDTLRDPHAQGRFAVLNNGITVVGRTLQTTGHRFALTDYQIVNGCQTSHVLFDERESIGPEVHVPFKVIVTQDEDIISSIITATNRQTQVTPEDLYALSSFQKRLEALFESYPDKKKLYYERRSRQYNAVPGIEKVRIISKQQQIRTFAAMFLDDPHRASRYYSDLRALVGTKIFHENHKLDPYYTAAYAAYKLEYLFRNGSLPVSYKPGRYHLLMAFRYAMADKPCPSLEANKVQPYCTKLCEALWSDERAIAGFRTAIAAVDTALKGLPMSRDVVKTQTFTDAVKAALGVGTGATAEASIDSTSIDGFGATDGQAPSVGTA